MNYDPLPVVDKPTTSKETPPEGSRPASSTMPQDTNKDIDCSLLKLNLGQLRLASATTPDGSRLALAMMPQCTIDDIESLLLKPILWHQIPTLTTTDDLSSLGTTSLNDLCEFWVTGQPAPALLASPCLSWILPRRLLESCVGRISPGPQVA